jgi:hypothetical protein
VSTSRSRLDHRPDRACPNPSRRDLVSLGRPGWAVIAHMAPTPACPRPQRLTRGRRSFVIVDRRRRSDSRHPCISWWGVRSLVSRTYILSKREHYCPQSSREKR